MRDELRGAKCRAIVGWAGMEKREAKVVQGEASESEDEDEPGPRPLVTGDRNKPASGGPAVLVYGEASESDDEEETPTMRPTSLPPLTVNPNGQGDWTVIHSTSPGQLQESEWSSQSYPKYDSLLHRKLRERASGLRSHLQDVWAQLFESAAKDIHSSTQHLIKTQSVIPDVSNNLRLLTNDLFHLEDRIDIITSCSLLPDIHLPATA